MSEQWHYRVFGQDFGPIRFDELKQLAEAGTISRGDEVRRDSSVDWIAVENVRDLDLFSTRATAPESDESAPSVSSASDEWFCRFENQELGPLSFQELIEYTKGEQLSANDEVKLGVGGKWRRVGSIGRLAAVLPYEAVTPEIQAAVSSPPVSAAVPKAVVAPITPPIVTEQAPQDSAFDLAIARAEAGAEATELTVRRMIGFTLSPGCDSSWWAAINGAETGPIAFAQLFEWALSGHLKPGDFIRNGMYGQYTHAGNLPGLFVAVALVKHSKELIEQEKAKAAESIKQALAAKATPPVIAPVAVVPTPAPIRPAPVAEVEVKRPAPEMPVPQATSDARHTMSSPTSGGNYGGMASASTPSRAPTPAPRTFTPKKKEPSNSPISMILGLLSTPAGKGAIAALVVIALGWTYMANRNNSDIRRYKALKRILDDIRAKRFVKSTEVEEIKTRAKKVSSELTPELKGASSPVKKALLAAASDDLPKMIEQDLTKESNDEKNFVKRLNEVKKILKLK